jgi:hypothetical protein
VEIAAILVELAVWVELAVSAELAVWVGLAVSVERAELAELVGSVELAAGIAHPRCPQVVADAATGNTIQRIAVEPLIETERPQTDLEVARGATPSPTARPAPGNRLDDRAAICRATAGEEPLQATGLAARATVTGVAGEAERIVLEVVICRAAAAKTVMPSEEVPAATTDRALAPTASAALPAWDLEVEAGAVEAEAVGADRRQIAGG